MEQAQILFTKKNVDKKLIAKELGHESVVDFISFLDIEPLKFKPFSIKNKSLIFSSVPAVESFFNNGFLQDENIKTNRLNKIYAVGEKTKKKLREYGKGTFKTKKNAEELAKFIVENSKQEKFLHFCGNLTLPTIKKSLNKEKIDYQQWEVYKTTLIYPELTKKYDLIVFFSPSAVESYIKYNNISEINAVALGNTTAKALQKYQPKNIWISKESTLKDVISLVKIIIKQRNNSHD